MDISSATNAASWNRGAANQTTATGYDDLKKTLNEAFPGLSVAFGELPEDQKEQEKLAWAGKLAGLTIAPAAADRMQTDQAFRDKVIAGIKADQAEFAPGKTHTYQGQTIETVAHGTVVEKDGSINSWTISKSQDTTGDDDKPGAAKKKTFLEAILDKLKKQREADKISQKGYDDAVKDADQMRSQGKSEDEIAAKLREAYLATLSPGDSKSVGVETTA